MRRPPTGVPTMFWLALCLATPVPNSVLHAQADGGYTTEQATRGRRVYGAYCATCHGVDLEGAVGPALAGAGFLHRWSARGPADLYQLLRTSMPKPAVGSLSAEAYADVFTYILQRNGMPAGSKTFDGSAAMLTAVPLAGLAAAAGPAPAQPPAFIPGERSRPLGTGPTQTELTTTPDPANWLYHTGNYAGTRYSPLSEISAANVAGLQVACAYQVGIPGTFYAGPIIDRGVMYLTTARVTVAVDAATCRERWRKVWEPKDEALWPNNRGVAIKDGYVVRGTDDGYLVALDARDGALLWARQVASPAQGETITMPPLIFEDLVLIGPAGSENNIQGWIGAFRLADGQPVWRFNTVPRAGEPGAETWTPVKGIPAGGGAVWTPLSLDAAQGELFVAVTNPAPDLPAHLRPGKNLYTNAVVALDVRSGKLRWYDQLVPSDFHDWDLTQVSPLVRASVAGKERNLVITSGKDGLLHAIDRDTHERLYQAEVTTRRNVEAPLTREGTVACPGILGGVEWNGPAYHPGTGLLYVPAVDWCWRFALTPDDSVRYQPGDNYLGGTVEPVGKPQGWLTAVDVHDGSVRWRYRSSMPMVAAATTTGGGVVFTGEQTGDFLALDAATGKELFRFYTGGGLFGGIATYAVNGRQFVAATSGGGSLTFGSSGSATLFVFALPGPR
jgi:alcohol dehydrogenase (cytochrome c)